MISYLLKHILIKTINVRLFGTNWNLFKQLKIFKIVVVL